MAVTRISRGWRCSSPPAEASRDLSARSLTERCLTIFARSPLNQLTVEVHDIYPCTVTNAL
jgi:hypothetical protein